MNTKSIFVLSLVSCLASGIAVAADYPIRVRHKANVPGYGEMWEASNGLELIPYCLWGNREPGNEMQVWLSTGKSIP